MEVTPDRRRVVEQAVKDGSSTIPFCWQDVELGGQDLAAGLTSDPREQGILAGLYCHGYSVAFREKLAQVGLDGMIHVGEPDLGIPHVVTGIGDIDRWG